LKWAQTADKKIAGANNKRLFISNDFTNKLMHRRRSEEAAILIGTNTAELDNPALTNRLWYGKYPVRLLLDKHLRLSHELNLFDNLQKTIVFNLIKHGEEGNIFYYKINDTGNHVHQIVNACYQLNILSIMVEGGAQLLQSFIDENLWDEANIITGKSLFIHNGLDAPVLHEAKIAQPSEQIFSDNIEYFYNPALP
jgi:diaminohydroxyphosphoribosylaminopyrimidine deaminase/5-amino-6-(5-phosphoribosylamino)uracil reductase